MKEESYINMPKNSSATRLKLSPEFESLLGKRTNPGQLVFKGKSLITIVHIFLVNILEKSPAKFKGWF